MEKLENIPSDGISAGAAAFVVALQVVLFVTVLSVILGLGPG